MINNVFAKGKLKRGQSDVDKHDNPRVVIGCNKFSGKGEPVGVIDDPHKQTTFAISMTRNGAQSRPGRFLDEDNIETGV